METVSLNIRAIRMDEKRVMPLPELVQASVSYESEYRSGEKTVRVREARVGPDGDPAARIQAEGYEGEPAVLACRVTYEVEGKPVEMEKRIWASRQGAEEWVPLFSDPFIYRDIRRKGVRALRMIMEVKGGE